MKSYYHKTHSERLYNFVALCSIGVAIILLSACSRYNTLTNPMINRLKNRGPVSLSSDNPFVASNMLLDQQVEESPDVKGFIEKRGAPMALEVTQEGLSRPSVHFFYPENAEYYNLEYERASWIILGPIPLTGDKLQSVLEIATSSSSGKTPSAATHTHAAAVQNKATEHAVNKEEKESKQKSRDKESKKSEAKKTLPDAPLIKELVAKGGYAHAELSPKGDLVHYVKFKGETLRLISRWYTFDGKNSDKIARVSGFSPKKTLHLGDTVVIPAYLLKNKTMPSQEAVTTLKEK